MTSINGNPELETEKSTEQMFNLFCTFYMFRGILCLVQFVRDDIGKLEKDFDCNNRFLSI